MSFLSMF
jgi:hypothetical protein